MTPSKLQFYRPFGFGLMTYRWNLLCIAASLAANGAMLQGPARSDRCCSCVQSLRLSYACNAFSTPVFYTRTDPFTV